MGNSGRQRTGDWRSQLANHLITCGHGCSPSRSLLVWNYIDPVRVSEQQKTLPNDSSRKISHTAEWVQIALVPRGPEDETSEERSSQSKETQQVFRLYYLIGKVAPLLDTR